MAIIRYKISGTIYDPFDAPFANITVQAFDKDLRTEQLLGEALTDANGFYKISYDAAKWLDSDAKSADVFIRVINKTSAGPVELGESPVYFNVPKEFTIDYKVGNAPIRTLNEFDALVNVIKPLTDPQNVTLADLQENDKFKDISFLANETGQSADRIALLPAAFTLAGKTRIAADIFYGLFRLQYPTDLNALLLIQSDSIAKGIRLAASENIISAKWGEQADGIAQQFDRQATSTILSGSGDQSAAFKQVMTAALPSADQLQVFVDVFLANESTPEKFWDMLAEQTGFDDPKTIANVQSVLQLNLLTYYQPALTTLLFKEQQQNPALKDMRGFAVFSFDDWHTRISKLVTDGELKNFPDGITGDTPGEKAANYATNITQLVKALYPTDVFATRLSQDSSAAFKESKSDLTAFFAKNGDYDLKNNTINQALAAANLTGIGDTARLKKELSAINRLYKLTDDYSHVGALRLQGIDSATTLVNTFTPAQFAEKFGPSMPPETAAAIYKNAEQIDNRAAVLAMGLKMRNDIPIYAINGPTNDAPPDYASLFGGTNCDCEHCRSVYSPSAYFVDCLNTLKKYNPDAFDKLTGRRPDLTEILLTCSNTNTPLPYIDLVNELLENTIAPVPPVMVAGTATYPHFQTTNTADELLAFPEHVDTAAYDQLKTPTASFDRPLNLALEETRLYMDKLGVARYDLMERFFGKQPHSIYADLPIASEYLRLSQIELNIVNGTTPMPVNLGKVTDFLNDTGLSYIDMLQLLECYFVNPLVNGERSIKVVAIVDDQNQDPTSCRLEYLTLQSMQPTSLKILPFIRLHEKSGWDWFDLDRVLTGLGISDLTGDVNMKLIIPLSHVARLKAKWNLSVQTIMSLWSTIDTNVYVDHAAEGQPQLPTQYENLFQNKQVTNPVDPDLSDPGGLAGLLVSKSQMLVAALNLTQQDFETLLQTNYVDGNLTLNNLSVLFRHAMLARALRLSVVDLIGAIDLTGGDPPFGDASNTADTLMFIDRIDRLRAFGFSIPELKGLLAKSASDPTSANSNAIAGVLTALRDGLKKIELLTPVGDTADDQAADKRQNQNDFTAETIAAAFKTEAKVIDVLTNELVKSAADNTQPAITPFIDAAFIDSEGPLYTIDSSNVITWAFPKVHDTYVGLAATWNRISRLLSKLKVTPDEFIYFQHNENTLLISGIWNLPTSPTGRDLFTAFEKLVNLIRFRETLVLPTPDWFTLFDFAIVNDADAKKNFIASLVGLSQLPADFLDSLLGDVAESNATGLLNYALPTDYLDGTLLVNLINCAKTAKQLGIRPEEIGKLILADPSDAQEIEAADIAKSLLKAQYDLPTWLHILQPISDQLRVRKRDALTSYLLTSPHTAIAKFRQDNAITDINSLYAYFLIDLKMDACMLTSRIKQAISSTQLFVDRCLMNLEAGIVLSPDFTRQWNTWRDRYRIWEANRKIFLYPENWIEPELRDDKSPFFKELESQLKQNEITAQTAEDALRSYLEKLDTVANLEMVGVYPNGLTGIVHVIGRTRNIPHQYFYTRQIKSVWSAWEKIDLDIEGDHILPVVWNNRLMLFWAQFNEKEAQDPGGFHVPAAPADIPPNPKYFEVKLLWSEYKNNRWASKNISKDALRIDSWIRDHRTNSQNAGDPSLYSLSSLINGEKLFIRLFVSLSFGLRTIQNDRFGGFYFDGCHDSPSIDAPDNSITGSDIVAVYVPNGTQNNLIFIDEKSSDALSLFDTGIYKKYSGKSTASNTKLFNNTPGKYRLLPEHHEIEKTKPAAFFYNNDRNSFYVHSIGGFIHPFPANDISVLTRGMLLDRMQIDPIAGLNSAPELSSATSSRVAPAAPFFVARNKGLSPFALGTLSLPPVFFGKHYAFQTFYHPYVCDLTKTLNTEGIEGIYKNQVPDTDGTIKDGIQNRLPAEIFVPNGAYDPTKVVQRPYPLEQVDFSHSGVYSIYNWELFFHIPLLIATRLSQDKKFDEARKWFHYIFDPTRSLSPDISGPERFWIPKPFKEEIRRGILTVEELLNQDGPDLDLQLSTWESNPFNPHAVARLRVSAYMRSTLKKYIDNLIAWGDKLFAQDTLETINEATLLYVSAANLLGRKPDRVPARATPQENSFSTLQDNLDMFSNAKVAIESFFSLSDTGGDNSIDSVMMPLFCLPRNDMLLGYWDTVADRLFKIRNCLNIEGVYRQLPLFEPPIDPALLVKAAAAGLELSSILKDMNTPLPNYRFQVLLQKANELCSDVKGLGSELLSALEKKDAEQLALLRSSHEVKLLQAVRDIKASQVDEAIENLNSLNRSRDVIQDKKNYYENRPFKNEKERHQSELTNLSLDSQKGAIAAELIGTLLAGLPEVTVGLWSWGATFGGQHLAEVTKFASSILSMTANMQSTAGNLSGIEGGFLRRQDDWKFQAHSADLELKQLDKQIAAAEIRLAMAQKELANHNLQIEQSQEVSDFLHDKYTDEELYDYMVGQISTVYFQSYQLAYNTAKKAETCFQHESSTDNNSFINFGYWNSLKKGLLSGEKLQYDLRRLEAAYMDQNIREYELTKHVSLVQVDPIALLKLRQNGECFVDIPETVFDMDYPGHYFRRLRSVGLSIPCVAGPYTALACTLTLSGNHLRIDNTLFNGKYGRDLANQDPRFRDNIASVQSIATSNAQNDHGVFELNFRDERYLPFEGAGAISSWQIKLNKNFPQFDFSTITDVIIHLNFTAREGGDDDDFSAKAAAEFNASMNKLALSENKKGLFRVYDLKREYSDKWYKFLHPATSTDDQQIIIDDLPDRLPFFTRQFHTKKVEKIEVVAFAKNANDKFKVQLSPLGTNPSDLLDLVEDSTYQGLHRAFKELTGNEIDLGSWTMKIQADGAADFRSLPGDSIDDLFLIINYTIA